MGNSEVGHLNLGAGRIVYQDFTRINLAIEDGSLAPTSVPALEGVKTRGRKLHLIGLFSDGGVHSHIDHLFALIDIANAAGVTPVLHLITDGRDMLPERSRLSCALEAKLKTSKGLVALVSGRYFTMDRDKRWERTEKGYRAIVEGKSDVVEDSPSVPWRKGRYRAEDVTDEFIPPVVIAPGRGAGHCGRATPSSSSIFAPTGCASW